MRFMHLSPFLAFLAYAVATTPALARPVAYADGSMLMLSHDADRSSATYLYSPTAFFGVGPTVSLTRKTESLFAGITANALIKRWNNPESQGNIYLLSNWGLHGLDHDTPTEPGGTIAAQADWEDRRFFVSYEPKWRFSRAEDQDGFEQRGRVGVAPYIAEAGALHSWVMLQVDHQPQADDHWTLTPLVRVFKGPVLAEAGMSTRGKLLLNFDITF